jgi:hypothetical protein
VYSLSQRSALAFFLVQRYFDFLPFYRKLKDGFAQANPPDASAAVTRASPEREDFMVTMALLDEIRSIAESRNAKFLIVATSRWWNSPSGGTYREFINTLQDKGFLVLDVESMPGFDPEKMNIPDDGHWNQSGHAFVAERIKGFIEMHQLLGQR